MDFADARPTKRFFIAMLTTDIALEDAILDLVDNSIDALSRMDDLDLSENLLFGAESRSAVNARIEIRITEREIQVSDNCGGISKEDVVNNVFRIGRVIPSDRSSIGVYGIGMKRAIFKIGNAFDLTSRTDHEGFTAHLDDIDTWANDDSPVWQFPVEDGRPAKNRAEYGTTLRIWKLRETVRRRIREGTLLTTLRSAIERTYPLFLGRFVTIELNGVSIGAQQLPIGDSENVHPAIERFEVGGSPPVRVTVLAGLAPPQDDEWTASRAGWYVICNGRVVVSADKSDLTGWGTKFLPQFHTSKYRAFCGIVFFFSEDPASLPWTTTKRGVDRDSIVFQKAQPYMSRLGRGVLAFINRWYSNDLTEEPAEREVASAVRQQDVRVLATGQAQPFSAVVKKRSESEKIKIQFDATIDELEEARRCLGKPRWSGVKVGRYAFDYFLRNECAKDE